MIFIDTPDLVEQLSRKIITIISRCYNFLNSECPIFQQTINMIYYNNNLTTQLLNHLTRSEIRIVVSFLEFMPENRSFPAGMSYL